MKSWQISAWIVGLSIVISCGLALAAPIISEVDEGFSQGAIMTARGSSFGTKSPAAPWRYADWEDGTNGEALSEPGWHTYNNYGGDLPIYSNEHSRAPGHLASKQGPFGNSTLKAGAFPNGANGGEIYISGYFWGIQNGGSRSCKFININGGEWTNPVMKVGGQDTYYWATVKNCSGIKADEYGGVGSHPYRETWERWEFSGKMDSNGYWRAYRGGELVNDFQGNYAWNCSLNDVYMTSYWGTWAANDGSYSWSYWDEVYIDITKARIELGNNRVFENCSHREIQIPTDWSPTSVTFKANLGIFDGSSDTYLFVIDSSGQASEGKLVTFGNPPPPPEGPGQPGQPEIQ